MTTETTHLRPAPWAITALARFSDLARERTQKKRGTPARPETLGLTNTSLRMADHHFNERTRLAIHHLPF